MRSEQYYILVIPRIWRSAGWMPGTSRDLGTRGPEVGRDDDPGTAPIAVQRRRPYPLVA